MLELIARWPPLASMPDQRFEVEVAQPAGPCCSKLLDAPDESAAGEEDSVANEALALSCLCYFACYTFNNLGNI